MCAISVTGVSLSQVSVIHCMHECLLQELCLLASNMVDFSKIEMNNLLNNQDSWLLHHLSVSRTLQEVSEEGRGGWRREGVDLLGDNKQLEM